MSVADVPLETDEERVVYNYLFEQEVNKEQPKLNVTALVFEEVLETLGEEADSPTRGGRASLGFNFTGRSSLAWNAKKSQSDTSVKRE